MVVETQRESCSESLRLEVGPSPNGHGMQVHGHADHEHWGRRLMSSPTDGNQTESKNCTEPCKHIARDHSPLFLLLLHAFSGI
ncbi:unnamed protein product [Arctogadus glacialis]